MVVRIRGVAVGGGVAVGVCHRKLLGTGKLGLRTSAWEQKPGGGEGEVGGDEVDGEGDDGGGVPGVVVVVVGGSLHTVVQGGSLGVGMGGQKVGEGGESAAATNFPASREGVLRLHHSDNVLD